MKRCMVMAAVLAAALAGCGENPLRGAREALLKLRAEFNARAPVEIEGFEPRPIDMVARVKSQTRDASAIAQVEGQPYVQGYTAQHQYQFRDADYSQRPYTVTLEDTYWYTLYQPVTREQYLEAKRKNGGVYNPTREPIDGPRIKAKVTERGFEYDPVLKSWKETSSKVIYPIPAAGSK